jgi:DNA-directed RNA polymerase subunit RPC12/RpoP
MENCKDCNSQYDTTKVNVPSPIPDYMCATCGTQLTEAQALEIPTLKGK